MHRHGPHPGRGRDLLFHAMSPRGHHRGGWGGPASGATRAPWAACAAAGCGGATSAPPSSSSSTSSRTPATALMEELERRSNGAWRPSPGSVYPTLQQLEDEGLIRQEPGEGRTPFTLTDEGKAYVADHREALGEPWAKPSEGIGEERLELRGLVAQIGAATVPGRPRPATTPRSPRPRSCWRRPAAASTRSWPTTSRLGLAQSEAEYPVAPMPPRTVRCGGMGDAAPVEHSEAAPEAAAEPAAARAPVASGPLSPARLLALQAAAAGNRAVGRMLAGAWLSPGRSPLIVFNVTQEVNKTTKPPARRRRRAECDRGGQAGVRGGAAPPGGPGRRRQDRGGLQRTSDRVVSRVIQAGADNAAISTSPRTCDAMVRRPARATRSAASAVAASRA